MSDLTAAVVTVGTELLEGIRLDTNTRDVAHALAPRGFVVNETVSVGDDAAQLTETLQRLTTRYSLVVTTGGLGPTHDDITAQCAAAALGRPLVRDDAMVEFLLPFRHRHRDEDAAEQVMRQALIIDGAEVLVPAKGTAPGQVAQTKAGQLLLLPGPPAEMGEMLERYLGRYELVRCLPRELGVVGLSESDAQILAQRALEGQEGIDLTILSRPGDVRVILIDRGAGGEVLALAADAVASELGDHCYATDNSTLAEVVVRAYCEKELTIAAAESCTGGMVTAAITDVSGASRVLVGGVVSYANQAKSRLLGVAEETLAAHGAVSEQTALAMAQGVRKALGSDIAVAVTGVAGPEGGSAEKPVGNVWFAIATIQGARAFQRQYSPTSRAAIRERATSTALDLLRREIMD